ncbi:translocation/assembly module TamB domain-containing protein [Novosphingobium sp. TH158]|uniref:translocation/assembly module TamB domain-containing protein n=1 Tax=Novosphingobium sp. TH158 TaxID=2067455 RepID=UPI000C7B8400|nr:translocation/assembly module TamB domain-containing protein [Novosphingobium sp. TH158]PLK25947.1 hypothetical protein C0V78_02860 [Novosphingobium sp. TH158]
MAEEPIAPVETDKPVRRRVNWRRTARWSAGVFGALLLLLGLALVWLDTGPGRRFVAERIAQIAFENGMSIHIGRIDGSIYGRMTLHAVSVRDGKGQFLQSPRIEVDWKPTAWLRNRIDVRSVTAQTVVLERRPALHPTTSKGPILPDIDIDIGKLRIDRFIAEAPVAGERRGGFIEGRAHIADGRALVDLSGSLAAPDGRLHDRMRLSLDANPDADRFALNGTVDAPAEGVIATLAGIREALVLRIGGSGSWSKWNGRLDADLAGSELARLALGLREGTFSLTGTARADRLVSGQLTRALQPMVRIDLTARPQDRRVALDGTAASDGVELAVKGVADLSDNTFDRLALDLQLDDPAVLGTNLAGSPVLGRAVLDGPFARPRADYTIDAARLAIGDMALEQLHASGAAVVNSDRILVPVSARVARITGLDAVAGGTLRDVRLAGDLAVDGTRVLSDNMRLKSERIDAKAVLLADLSKGFYAGALNGQLGNYRLASVGTFNLTTALDLESNPRGFSLSGTIRARSLQLVNESLRDLLGGNFTAASRISYGPDGVIRLSGLRLNAPLLSISDVRGGFVPGGAINFDAAARSRHYGALGFRLSGTFTQPRAQVSAERPGLGIGLANLKADIAGVQGGYRLLATGETDYGPLSADATLFGGKTTRIRIDRADLSGIVFAGSLVRSGQGPFTGELSALGNGVTGKAVLAAQGSVQAVQFNLRANDTVLPGPAQLAVGMATADGRIVLYEQPQVTGDFQLADTSFRGYRIDAARVAVDYRGGQGTARALVEGRSVSPFRIAANAQLQPGLWRAMLTGRVGGIDFATVGPARIVPLRDGYELQPVRVNAGKGSMRLAGRFGDGIKLESRLDSLDLAIFDVFYPDSGLTGKATGVLDFAQASASAFPSADARLSITGFTRLSPTGASRPVDLQVVGRLLPDGGEAKVVIRQRGAVIGRLAASLRPLGPDAGSWLTRLRAAPLGGGIRYNGPAETLFSFAAPAGHSFAGPIGMAADFSCKLENPCLNGIIRANSLVYENTQYGTRLTDMAVNGRFGGDRIEFASLTAKAGNGTVEARGYVSLSQSLGYPMDLAITLDNARLARSDAVSGSATGKVRLTKVAAAAAVLSGELVLPEARYRIVRQGAAEVPQLTGVRFKQRGARLAGAGGGEAGQPAAPSLFPPVRLDLQLLAPQRLQVEGMGLQSEWSSSLRVSGTTASPLLDGELRLVRGSLDFAGRSFDLTSGRIAFTPDRVGNPSIAVSAVETIDDATVTVAISGRALNPQITFASVPGLPQDEILSRVLFGRSIAGVSSLQAVQLAASLNTLRGGSGGLTPLGKLRAAAGIDRLRIIAAQESPGGKTAFAAGKYITDDIYLELITDAQGFTATQLEISITRWLSILSQAGQAGVNNFNVRIRKDY